MLFPDPDRYLQLGHNHSSTAPVAIVSAPLQTPTPRLLTEQNPRQHAVAWLHEVASYLRGHRLAV